VGRLCEQKGQILLIEAARRLVAEGESFEIVLAGDGELRPEIDNLVAEYKLGDTIRITGWLDGHSVREVILSARAMVLPSFAEGLPVSIMESLALERPVISTFVAGIPELVTRDNGWLVPPGDVEALTDAIRDCLRSDSEHLSRMGRAGRTTVLRRHNVEDECRHLMQLFAKSIRTEANRTPHAHV
jgi:glycosyltransferase involved in cell wall biosynthesis